MDELEKLYGAVSSKFDIGTKEEFTSKMGDVESRKRFYDSVSGKGFDLGDYNEYESRLSSTTPIPEQPKGENAKTQNGESSSVLADTDSSSDSKFVNPNLSDPNETIAKKAITNQMELDKEFQSKITELQNVGDIEGVEQLKQQYVEEAYLKAKPESDLSKKIKENFKDAPELELSKKTAFEQKYDNLASRSDFKYKDSKIYEGAEEKEGQLVNVSSEGLKKVYGDIDNYGIDIEDFNSYVESGNDKIKKLSRAGYFDEKTDDVLLTDDQGKKLREAAKNQALVGYVGDRLTHLKGKHLGLVKQGKTNEAKRIESEIIKTAKGYQNYVTDNLPNYKKEYQDKLTREYNEYVENNNIGDLKKALTTTRRSISSVGKGIMSASGDVSTYLLDLVGADDLAEHQRMINDYNKEFDNSSLQYGVVSGKKVFHKGTNYLTTDTGRIIDVDAGKEITSIADKLNIDKEELLEKGKNSSQEDTSYSPSGLIIKGSEVLGNLVFQLASTRGVGGAVGATSKVGTIATSMAVQSGMVASSVYEETLAQLRSANINDDLAKGEALELSMKMGAVTALTSVFSPNTSALGMTTKSVDKGLTKKLAASYVSGGKEAFKSTLWKQIKEKGIAMTKEGFEESLQELTEMVAQKGLNAGVNENLGTDALDTEITKDEVIETFILSHATAGMMAANAKTSGEFRDKLSVIEHLSKDVEKSTSFIKSFKEEGAISPEIADKMVKDVTVYAKYSNKIPNDVSLEKVEPLLDILDKRNELENRKKNEDKAFHGLINEQITSLDENITKLMNSRVDQKADVKEPAPEQYARPMKTALKNQNDSDKKTNLPVGGVSQEQDQGGVEEAGNVYKFKTNLNKEVSTFKSGEIKHISTFLTKTVSEEVHEDISKYQEVFTNDKVYALAKKAGVKVVLLTDEIKKHPLLNVEGGKYLGDGVILINPKYINKKYLGTNTIQHESAHAYTCAVLLSKSTETLTEQERIFKKNVETIFKSKKTFLDRAYGFKSSSEFVAEFLSNDNFKRYIKGENLTLYEKIKQLLATFINKQTDLNIEDVISNFENYLQEGISTSSQEQIRSKKIKESSKKIADNIRKIKVNSSVKGAMSKLNSRPTAVFEAAWDGAIETVATSVELTGDLTQAISDGLKILKESDWYTSLSEGGKRKAERMFKEDLNREFDDDSGNTSPSFLDSIKASIDKTTDVLTQKLVDKFHILRKEVDSKFDIYDDSVNFSQAEKLMHGKAANDLELFDKKMEDIIKDIASRELTIDNISNYMYAKHAEERNKYVKENIDPENEFGSGMTSREIDKILNKTFTEDQIKDLEKVSKDFSEVIEGTRQIMLEHGLISQDQYNTFVGYYENYVPLQGFENPEIESSNDIQGSAIDISGAQVKRASGRSTRADNVVANIISQRVKATINARKNEVLKTLHKLASENLDNDVVKVYSSETLPKKLVVQADGTKVNQPENPFGRQDYVGVKIDGEQFYLKFANKELGRVLNAANIEKTDLVTKTLGKFNRYLSTTLTTLDPEFVISNFARDIQTAVFNVSAEAGINESLKGQNIAKQVVKDTGKSIRAIYANERKGKVNKEFQKYYDEFKEDGAKTGWANQNNLADIKKKLESIHKMSTSKGLNTTTIKKGAKDLLGFIEDINTSVENGVRLSAYVNARKVGATRTQAAELAKELTVNFNQSGEWGTLFNSLYLFFNAAIQGNVRFIKAMTTLKKTVQKDGSIKKSLNGGQKIALSMAAFSSVVAMLNQAISDDDEDGESFYNKIPDYEKERNLIFMNPANGKDYFKLPLPYGYNIFHNMGTIATEVSTGDRTVGDGIGFLTTSFIGAFSPISFGNSDNLDKNVVRALAPTVTKPVVDLAMNEDFFGSQIYNENFPFSEPVPDAARGRKTTPNAFKNVSKFMNEVTGGNDFESGSVDVSPESLYYMFKFVIGGTGKFLNNTAETTGTVVDKIQGEDVQIESRKTPFVRKVYAEPNDYVDQESFYNRYDLVRQRTNAIKDRLQKKEASLQDRKDYSKVAGMSNFYKETAKQLSKLRKKKKQAQKIDDPIKKTKQLRELDETYFKFIKRANGKFNERLGKNYK